jgi:hypothetical protein
MKYDASEALTKSQKNEQTATKSSLKSTQQQLLFNKTHYDVPLTHKGRAEEED